MSRRLPPVPRLFALGIRPGLSIEEASGIYVLNYAGWTTLAGEILFSALNAAAGNWRLFAFNLAGAVICIAALGLLARGRSFLALGTLCLLAGGLFFLQALVCGNGNEVLLLHFFVINSFLMVPAWGRRLVALACGTGFVLVQAAQFQASGVKGVTLSRFTVNYVVGMVSLYVLIALLRWAAGNYRRALEEQRRVLEEANGEKERLFALVSHDLRGPIVRLKDAVDHLVAGRLTPERFEAIQGLLRADIHQLHALVENVLQWSAGQISSPGSHPERLPVRAAAEEALKLLALAAQAKGIAVENRIPPEAVVLADAGQFQALLRNLASNAVKFASPGGWVRLDARRDGAAWEIAVADSGSGGESGAAPVRRVLAGEETEPVRGTADERGFGLGLRLCRDIVRAQGGTIRAEAGPDGGTILRVTLPEA